MSLTQVDDLYFFVSAWLFSVGYRYELFCLVKHARTPHCLVSPRNHSDTRRHPHWFYWLIDWLIFCHDALMVVDVVFLLKVYCLTSHDVSSAWNSSRDAAEQYAQDVWVSNLHSVESVFSFFPSVSLSFVIIWLDLCSFDALVSRFEAPDSRNRWDSPLFTILKDDGLPFQDISDALFKRKAPPANQSTQSVRDLSFCSLLKWM